MIAVRRVVLRKRRHVAVPEPRFRHRPDLIPRAQQMFGAVIREARREMGWSQEGLGARCGLHQSTVSRLEAGKLEGLAYHRLIVLLYVLREPLQIDRLLTRAGRSIDRAAILTGGDSSAPANGRQSEFEAGHAAIRMKQPG